MKNTLIALSVAVAVSCLGVPASWAEPEAHMIIPWQDTAKHYGEHATVVGTIVVTHNSGKACFLNFHPDYKRYFTAVIFASVFSRFPANPENYYIWKESSCVRLHQSI